ncbi:MAG: hypothetical protein V3V99_13435 [candidate division Zixibacteria bacterium]
MQRTILFIFGIILILIIFGCAKEFESSLNSQEGGLYYGFFARINASDNFFSKRIVPTVTGSKIFEPIVNWEESLGEPFIDINANGIYDAGIDSFNVSIHDLNGNLAYDSPDDPWSEGIPFDDIDGNGLFRENTGERITGYVAGMPYADFNNGGTRDIRLDGLYGVLSFNSVYWYGGRSYAVKQEPASYQFISDSGLTYDLPFGFESVLGAIVIWDTGMYYRRPPFTVPLLDTGKVVPSERNFEFNYPDTSAVYHRLVSYPKTLTVDGMTLSNLLYCQLTHESRRYGFYFSRDNGLVAYEFWILSNPWYDEYHTIEYYFRRIDGDEPLVFPTSR